MRQSLPIPIVFSLISFWILGGCSPAATPTLFIAPTNLPLNIPNPELVTASPIALILPTTPPESTPTPMCQDDLSFVQDVTFPDGTAVRAGQAIDKQWLVTNSGTCNWDSNYRLKFVGGDPLGAAKEQALYPAREGTQATLDILFTAPTTAAGFHSAWQAENSAGQVFGQQIYIQFIVTP